MIGRVIAVAQLRFPKRELWIAGTKREHRIRQGAAVHRARVDAHQDSAVGTAFNFPTGEIVQGRLGSALGLQLPLPTRFTRQQDRRWRMRIQRQGRVLCLKSPNNSRLLFRL